MELANNWATSIKNTTLFKLLFKWFHSLTNIIHDSVSSVLLLAKLQFSQIDCKLPKDNSKIKWARLYTEDYVNRLMVNTSVLRAWVYLGNTHLNLLKTGLVYYLIGDYMYHSTSGIVQLRVNVCIASFTAIITTV